MYSDLALCSEPPLEQMARFRFSSRDVTPPCPAELPGAARPL